MGFIKDFKEFAVKGNALDLAVGVIIGGAFGKIVASLVSDIIMPPIGFIIGGINFKDIKILLKQAVTDTAGTITSPEISINLGNFLQAVLDFTIIAFTIFLLVKGINNLKKKKEEETPPPTPPEPSNEEKLLTEIRDLLKKQ